MSDMKLSEAIRLGSMLKPQCVEGYFDGVGTCAMGAAFDAIGKLEALSHGNAPELAHAYFPVIRMVVPHPVTTVTLGLSSVIFRLNDLDKWTREQIADWVQGIEDAQATRIACADQAAMEPALALPSAAQKV